jgi:two-component system OmpR family sensor kinase
MRRIQQETIRMSRLVDDLLLLARLDEARATTRDYVDVAALLRDAAADTAVIDPKRVVSLRVTEPLVTLGDEHELHQVVGAVLSNALRYTKGPIQLIGSPAPHGNVTIEVVDEGPGMDPNVASRIFERFFRGDAGRARGDGGSGLGLAIVKSIVTAHGGQAEVETSPTSGTRIRIVLPGSPPAARRQPELAPHLS